MFLASIYLYILNTPLSYTRLSLKCLFCAIGVLLRLSCEFLASEGWKLPQS